ncbi:MAG: hypothetical protein QHC67_01975 [Sphingobium sp.]|nr:hypothetical protein [Sphingobium sp.]MDX3908574.1 hypothetical protein [Sphingobium sp.]
MLNPFQRACADVYGGGDFAHGDWSIISAIIDTELEGLDSYVMFTD